MRKQEEEDRLKQQDQQNEERRKLMAQKQIEQSKMFQQEVRHSYKSELDNQMTQKTLLQQQQMQEKANFARIQQQQVALNREKDDQVRQFRMQQQAEYREVLNRQKQDRGLGLAPIVGDVPYANQNRIRSGRILSPPQNVPMHNYASQAPAVDLSGANAQTYAPQSNRLAGNSLHYNVSSMPTIPQVKDELPAAGVRRLPQF